MIRIQYILWFLYSLLLAWDIYSSWGTGATMAWVTASLWYFFWMLDQVLDERRQKRTFIRSIKDTIKMGAQTMRIFKEYREELAEMHSMHVRQLEQRIWELERNAKKDTEAKRSR